MSLTQEDLDIDASLTIDSLLMIIWYYSMEKEDSVAREFKLGHSTLLRKGQAHWK